MVIIGMVVMSRFNSLCATAQQSYCRPDVRRPQNPFSQKRLSELMPKLG